MSRRFAEEITNLLADIAWCCTVLYVLLYDVF